MAKNFAEIAFTGAVKKHKKNMEVVILMNEWKNSA